MCAPFKLGFFSTKKMTDINVAFFAIIRQFTWLVFNKIPKWRPVWPPSLSPSSLYYKKSPPSHPRTITSPSTTITIVSSIQLQITTSNSFYSCLWVLTPQKYHLGNWFFSSAHEHVYLVAKLYSSTTRNKAIKDTEFNFTSPPAITSWIIFKRKEIYHKKAKFIYKKKASHETKPIWTNFLIWGPNQQIWDFWSFLINCP